MTTQLALHIPNAEPARAKSLGVRPAILTPEQAARNRSSDILRAARGTCSQASLADAAGVPQQHVAQWEDPDVVRAPSLLHLVRAAELRPSVVADVARGLLALCDRGHVAMPALARVCSVMSEVGDVARELHAAMADGVITGEERATIRREIAEARAALDALERDIDNG